MKRARWFVRVCVVGVAWPGMLVAQSMGTQAAMHARVGGLYNFSPHTLNDAGRSAKSTEMDSFWSEVKAHQDLELPLLRTELKDASNHAFFMSDGSRLLLSLSHAPPDEALAVAAMSRADLADVDAGAYFYAVHALSMDGVDTTKAALHVLDDPKFAVIVPQHAMTLDQQSVLVYLLLPVKQDLWMEAARRRFAAEKDETAEKSLLGLFFYTRTSEGDAALASAAKDATKSEAVRQDAMHYQQDMKDAVKAKYDIKGPEASIREARRKRMGAVSDEAIDDMQEMTGRLIQLRSSTGRAN